MERKYYILAVSYTHLDVYKRQIKDNGYWPSFAKNLIPDLKQARVSNIDTDSAGQFIVGYLHEMRMASILAVIADRNKNIWGDNTGGEERASKACLLYTSCFFVLVFIGS